MNQGTGGSSGQAYCPRCGQTYGVGFAHHCAALGAVRQGCLEENDDEAMKRLEAAVRAAEEPLRKAGLEATAADLLYGAGYARGMLLRIRSRS